METKQLPSSSSHVPKLLPRLYPANSAKVHPTAAPTSAQINQHTGAPYDRPHPRHLHSTFGATGLWWGQDSAQRAHAVQMLQSGD